MCYPVCSASFASVDTLPELPAPPQPPPGKAKKRIGAFVADLLCRGKASRFSPIINSTARVGADADAHATEHTRADFAAETPALPGRTSAPQLPEIRLGFGSTPELAGVPEATVDNAHVPVPGSPARASGTAAIKEPILGDYKVLPVHGDSEREIAITEGILWEPDAHKERDVSTTSRDEQSSARVMMSAASLSAATSSDAVSKPAPIQATVEMEKPTDSLEIAMSHVLPPAAPALPVVVGHVAPCISPAARGDLERDAAHAHRAIPDTIAGLMNTLEPAPIPPVAAQELVGCERFVQRSLAAEGDRERAMGSVVSASMQSVSSLRATPSPRPAASHASSATVPGDSMDEEDIYRGLADAAAQKARLLERQRRLHTAESTHVTHPEHVTLRVTGLLGKEASREKRDEDEETVNTKKQRYQQYVARKAYEQHIAQMRGQATPLASPVPSVDPGAAPSSQPRLGVPAASTHPPLPPSTPQKDRGDNSLAPPSPSSTPSRLPFWTEHVSGGGSPARTALNRLCATVAALASSSSPSPSPSRPTVAPVAHSPTPTPRATPRSSRSSPAITPRLLRPVNVKTPSTPNARTRPQILTPRRSPPSTPCPNPTAHKVVTPHCKPAVPRAAASARTDKETTPTRPQLAALALASPGRGARRHTSRLVGSPKATTPARRAVQTDENAAVPWISKDTDAASKPITRPLLRTPLRPVQARSPAKAAFRV